MADPVVTLFGPLDTYLGPYITYVLLGLAVLNVATRIRANVLHRRAGSDDEDAITRDPLHLASTAALVLASMYYTTLHQHGGMVMTTLVLSLFLTDFFEFEARRVEAREGDPIERPKAAHVISSLVVLYAAFQSLFFIVRPLWEVIV